MVLIESMASGTPVIGTDLPGVRSVVSDNVGFLANPGDIDDLAGLITQMLSNEPIREQMGLESRKKAVSEYDWKTIGSKLNDIYLSL